MDSHFFVDYYELLQISPKAELETVHRVYRMLATRYHPDNPQTGDTERFLLLNEAYAVLTDPQARLDYDLLYHARSLEPLGVFQLRDFALGLDGENNRRMGLLCLLYNRRRTMPDSAGMSLLEFENLMSIAREHLMFMVWYLKESGFVRQEEGSDYAITAVGVKWVEDHLPTNKLLYQLLKASESGRAHADPLPDGPAPDNSAVS